MESKITEQDREAAEAAAGLTPEMKIKGFYVHDTMQGEIDSYLEGVLHERNKPVPNVGEARTEMVKGFSSMQAKYIEIGFDACIERVATPLEDSRNMWKASCEIVKEQLTAANEKVAELENQRSLFQQRDELVEKVCSGDFGYDAISNQLTEATAEIARLKVRVEGVILSLKTHGQNIDAQFHIDYLSQALAPQKE